MVEDRIELGDEYLCIRGVMQHEPGLPSVQRALGRQFPVKCAHAGTDRITTRQAARQPVAIRDQRGLVYPVFGEHRSHSIGIPADRAGEYVMFEDLSVREGHFFQPTGVYDAGSRSALSPGNRPAGLKIGGTPQPSPPADTEMASRAPIAL